MSDETISGQAAVDAQGQTQTAESGAQQAQTGEGQAAASVESDGVQAEGQSAKASGEEGIGPEKLPAELEETRKQLLRDYHEKTQKLAADRGRYELETERLKKDADTLQQLVSQEWFKKAMADERAKRNGQWQDAELTDDEFSRLTTDKRAFQDYFRKAVDRAVVDKVGGPLAQQQEKLVELEAEKEFQTVSSRYQDFDQLNKNGVLDPYLDAGHDFATAYKLYKFDHGQEELPAKISQEAQRLIQDKRSGAVDKTGAPKVNGARVYKAKNFDEAFANAWAAVSRGEADARIEREG